MLVFRRPIFDYTFDQDTGELQPATEEGSLVQVHQIGDDHKYEIIVNPKGGAFVMNKISGQTY